MKKIFTAFVLCGFFLSGIASAVAFEESDYAVQESIAQSRMYGKKGALVLAYQRTLNELGANIKENGVWDNETEKAYQELKDKISPYYGERGILVKKSQEEFNASGANIPEDGIWWDITERAYRESKNRKAEVPVELPKVVVEPTVVIPQTELPKKPEPIVAETPQQAEPQKIEITPQPAVEPEEVPKTAVETPIQPLVVTNNEGVGSVIVLTETQIEDEKESLGQKISGLLSSGRDPFVSATSYNLSPMRFRERGYDNIYNTVYINGALFNDAEGGRFSYGLIGGLNDATRNQESVNGIEPSDYSYGNLGGVTNIITRASQYGEGTKISLSASNRSYNGRLMATYSSGLMDNGWAYSITGSRRISIQGMEYIEGTFYDAWGISASIEKQFNQQHSLSFTAMFAPSQRGMQSASTQEAYDLAGTNFYNPNWGYQNGQVRNARVSSSKEPIAILNHLWKINDKLKLTTALGFKYSDYSTTALNWYNSSDPRPDYYRYLPSYFATENPEVSALMTDAWKNNESVRQLNWDKLYQINYLANLTGVSARYIVEERHNDQLAFNLNSTAKYNLNDHIDFTGGIHLSTTKGMHYKKINDLLGANYWVDVDQFAERDFSGNADILQNDINNPNRQVVAGDIFGYNYNVYVHKANLFANADFKYNKFDFYFAGNLSGTQFYREGLMKNGRAPLNSYGLSVKNNYLDFGVKGGATYKLTGRHIFTVNTSYQTNAPLARNAYLSPRIKDELVDGLQSEKIFTADFNYYLRMPNVSARFTVYNTMFWDQTDLNSFYHDDYRTYVNQVLVGVNKTHRGIEFGIDVKITPVVSVYGALALGEYLYTSRPTAITSFENGSRNDTTQVIYMKNFYVNGTPQVASSVGLKLALPNYWYIDVVGNYTTMSYIDFFPERRTSGAIVYGMTDEEIKAITEQEMLKGGFTLDASIGKSLRLFRKYTLNLNFSVSNILDNKTIQTGGFEQSRFDFETYNVNKFPPKYYYGLGRTWFLNIGFRF